MTASFLFALDAIRQLISSLGIDPNPILDPDGFIEALRQVGPRYKGERPLLRFQLKADKSQWSPDMIRDIMDAAMVMRMLEPETPLESEFDAVIALGGARQSNLDRTRYAAKAIGDGNAKARLIMVAGSNRPLPKTEKASVANYAPEAMTEADLCLAAANLVSQEFTDVPILPFEVKEENAGTPRILEAIFSVRSWPRVGVVTTQIYQLATELDAARIGKQFGVQTKVAGTPSDPKVIEARTPATYLSEVLRTLRAATLAVQVQV